LNSGSFKREDLQKGFVLIKLEEHIYKISSISKEERAKEYLCKAGQSMAQGVAFAVHLKKRDHLYAFRYAQKQKVEQTNLSWLLVEISTKEVIIDDASLATRSWSRKTGNLFHTIR